LHCLAPCVVWRIDIMAASIATGKYRIPDGEVSEQFKARAVSEQFKDCIESCEIPVKD
jgi:hypothetical protein